ncbi:hypothetical protein INT43_005660 [Umbelopsis isabellina]|uniref:Vacuolar-sorting protein SNF7 n=1 Tax=Mortierella isabellina TaxID=91625 RepID=A0A8H7UB57_MORIS|nr:hypothetical protein INT43_005660 [Umbelopsis isabellina]
MSAIMFCFRRRKSAKPKAKAEAPSSVPPSKNGLNSAEGDISTNFSSNGGRRFHNVENSQYLLPNDDTESDRLHSQHWIVRNVQGGNFVAPVEKELDQGIKVLDVGTGPGTWVLEMARDFISSTFIGIDISANWPQNIRPPNSYFQIANLNEELPFEKHSFDYIHLRFLGMGLTEKQYEDGYKKLLYILKPGGYIEIGECDVRFAFQNSIWNKFLETMVQSRGMSTTMAETLKDTIQDIGGCEVQETIFRYPLGPWGGKLGVLAAEDLQQVYGIFKDNMIQALRMKSPEEFDAAVVAEFKEFNRLHTSIIYHKIIVHKHDSSGHNRSKSKTTAKDSIVKLRETLSMLEKRQAHLETKAENEYKIAKLNATKNRRVALLALKKKKAYEGQIDKINGTRMTIETQVMAIENANVNLETMNALRGGAEAMRNIHGSIIAKWRFSKKTKVEKGSERSIPGDINKVDATMDEIRDQMDIANEISDAISRPVLGDELDEDELLNELEELEQEELDAKMLESAPPAMRAPNVPSHEPAMNTAVEDDEEAELKKLQASMAM